MIKQKVVTLNEIDVEIDAEIDVCSDRWMWTRMYRWIHVVVEIEAERCRDRWM